MLSLILAAATSCSRRAMSCFDASFVAWWYSTAGRELSPAATGAGARAALTDEIPLLEMETIQVVERVLGL